MADGIESRYFGGHGIPFFSSCLNYKTVFNVSFRILAKFWMFDVSGKSYNQSRRRLFVILDMLENGKNYVSLNGRFAEAFAFLAEKNFEELPDGWYEINGENLFAVVMSYITRPVTEVEWEARQKYLDIQYLARGKEIIGWAPLNQLTLSKPYSEEKDIAFLRISRFGQRSIWRKLFCHLLSRRCSPALLYLWWASEREKSSCKSKTAVTFLYLAIWICSVPEVNFAAPLIPELTIHSRMRQRVIWSGKDR